MLSQVEFARHAQEKRGTPRVSFAADIIPIVGWLALQPRVAISVEPHTGTLARFLEDSGAPSPAVFRDRYTDDRRLPGTAPLPEWAYRLYQQLDLLVWPGEVESLPGSHLAALVQYTYLYPEHRDSGPDDRIAPAKRRG